MVTRLYIIYLLTNGQNRASCLMAQNRGRRANVGAFQEVEVAPANAGGSCLNQYLSGTGIVDLNFFHLKRGVNFTENSSFHFLPLVTVRMNKPRYEHFPRAYSAVAPPSMTNSLPVMNDA